jgi:hypothetical protein
MNTFHPNSLFLFLLAGAVIVFVIAQSLVFLFKAWRRALELNLDRGMLRRIAVSSATFTIAPAVSILLGVITLSKFLGLPLPWLRLSVVGALTYELPAASTAAAAMGTSISERITDPKVFATIAWVMTLGIIPGIFYLPFLLKRIQSGLVSLKNRDKLWGDTFLNAMFLGMISAFLGVVFARVGEGISGWIPVFVMLTSIILMLICGILIRLFRWKWLEDFALPICMLGAMALSIPISGAIV